MDILTNLKTFLMVCRTGAFSEAARHLHVVPSVVTKRIAQLEKTTRSQLFERSSRAVVMTEAGHRLKASAEALVAQFEGVVDKVQRQEQSLEGSIHVLSPTTLTQFRLGALYDQFLAVHPGVTLDVSLVDRTINPSEESFDVVISGRSAKFPDVVDIPLFSVAPILCASPRYLHKHGVPEGPSQLAEHDCLVFRHTGSAWWFKTPRGSIKVDVRARVTSTDNYLLLQCALNDRGIALLPTYLSADAITAGTLVSLLPGFPPKEASFRAYVPRSRIGVARVQAFVAYLEKALKSE